MYNFPKGCVIKNIRRGTGDRAGFVYARLYSPEGELILSATLEEINEQYLNEIQEEEAVVFLLDLKIRSQTFKITTKDRFLDNGTCIQILTRKTKRRDRTSPILTIKAQKEIEAFEKVYHVSPFKNCNLFSLKPKTEE